VPFLLAAGAMQYSRVKFLSALVVGRGVRYSIAAYLGLHYGTHIMRFFSRYEKLAVGVLIGLAVVGGILSLIQYFRSK
jgi:membrane protein DedA with SNARE-associated domain